jgi:hypothetical protein
MVADTNDKDWSERDKPKERRGKQKKSSSGPSDLLRVMSPISNLASLRKGGKVRSKSRMKARS